MLISLRIEIIPFSLRKVSESIETSRAGIDAACMTARDAYWTDGKRLCGYFPFFLQVYISRLRDMLSVTEKVVQYFKPHISLPNIRWYRHLILGFQRLQNGERISCSSNPLSYKRITHRFIATGAYVRGFAIALACTLCHA